MAYDAEPASGSLNNSQKTSVPAHTPASPMQNAPLAATNFRIPG
jgi:hypothetical protein